MYIKKVIISNFKSYQDRTVVKGIDRRHNVVLGHNGSGKSNFLSAIEFVISSGSTLVPMSRQQYIHSVSQDSACYVTVVFDNSDRLIPIDEDEVSVCRMIGIKKDNYLLNGKYVTKNEVMEVLEEAGFCFSNPYSIIKQGQITKLMLQPDTSRLKLLLDVSGISKFDEVLAKAVVALKNCENEHKYINDILPVFKNRSRELDKEYEELKEHLRLTKRKSTLEYLIHYKEVSKHERNLNELKAMERKYSNEQQDLKNKLNECENEIKEATAKIEELNSKLLTLKMGENKLNEILQRRVKKKVNLDSTAADLKERLENDGYKARTNKQQLEELNKSIDVEKSHLDKIKKLYEEARDKEEKLAEELIPLEEKRSYLFAKEGRKNVFSSAEERNNWIRNEVETINGQIDAEVILRDNLMKTVEDYKRQGKALTEENERLLSELKQKINYIEHNLKKNLTDLQKNIDSLQAETEKLLREEENFDRKILGLKDEATGILDFSADRAISNGIRSVQKVLEHFSKSDGDDKHVPKYYYGLVIDNFTCKEDFRTAVEVTAKNQLFYHIVENQIIATKIIKEINRQNLQGIVNFMPLNKLQVPQIKYFKHTDYEPLMGRINFDDKFKVAMEFLFARTMVCRNLEIAVEISRKYNFYCVTIDGDQVSPRGVLTGGYFNPSKSKFQKYSKYGSIKKQIEENETSLSSIRWKIENNNAQILQLKSELCKIETDLSREERALDDVKGRLSLSRERLQNVTTVRADVEKSLTHCRMNLKQFQIRKEDLQNELEQEYLSQLSESEKEEINNLNVAIMNTQKELKGVIENRMKLELEKNKLKNILRNSWIPQRDRIVHDLQDFDENECKNELSKCEKEIAALTVEIDNIERSNAACANDIKSISDQLKNSRKRLEILCDNKKKLEDEIEATSMSLQAYQMQLENKKKAKDESELKMSKLTSAPSQDEILKYQEATAGNIVRNLEKVNANLKRFEYVNKKAHEQYLKINEYNDRLCDCEEKMKCLKALQEIIKFLVFSREMTVKQIFQEVKRNFSQIFEQLVPSGRGELIITSEGGSSQSSSGNSTEDSSLTGIAIKVSFIKSGATMQYLNQLSGGQKSVVILAFIFALQKYSPAPLYLLDEVDQALDVQSRIGLARLIHEFSEDSQFITTTFRGELLEYANKFYKVSIGNNVSNVESITKEEAESFITNS